MLADKYRRLLAATLGGPAGEAPSPRPDPLAALGWHLFLVAKHALLPPSPDLASQAHLLVACLALVAALAHRPHAPRPLPPPAPPQLPPAVAAAAEAVAAAAAAGGGGGGDGADALPASPPAAPVTPEAVADALRAVCDAAKAELPVAAEYLGALPEVFARALLAPSPPQPAASEAPLPHAPPHVTCLRDAFADESSVSAAAAALGCAYAATRPLVDERDFLPPRPQPPNPARITTAGGGAPTVAGLATPRRGTGGHIRGLTSPAGTPARGAAAAATAAAAAAAAATATAAAAAAAVVPSGLRTPGGPASAAANGHATTPGPSGRAPASLPAHLLASGGSGSGAGPFSPVGRALEAAAWLRSATLYPPNASGFAPFDAAVAAVPPSPLEAPLPPAIARFVDAVRPTEAVAPTRDRLLARLVEMAHAAYPDEPGGVASLMTTPAAAAMVAETAAAAPATTDAAPPPPITTAYGLVPGAVVAGGSAAVAAAEAALLGGSGGGGGGAGPAPAAPHHSSAPFGRSASRAATPVTPTDKRRAAAALYWRQLGLLLRKEAKAVAPPEPAPAPPPPGELPPPFGSDFAFDASGLGFAGAQPSGTPAQPSPADVPDMCSLLAADTFHRSLFAACCELVACGGGGGRGGGSALAPPTAASATALAAAAAASASLAQRLGVRPLDTTSLLPALVAADASLPREMKKALNRLAEAVVEKHAWAPGSSLYELLLVVTSGGAGRSGGCATGDDAAGTGAGGGSAEPFDAASAASQGVPLPASFAAARAAGGHAPTPADGPLRAFFSQVLLLSALRLTRLADRLGCPGSLLSSACAATEHALFEATHLFYGRQLDQLLLCALYGAAKAAEWHNRGGPLTFKDVIEAYRAAYRRDRGAQCPEDIYRAVVTEHAGGAALTVVRKEDIIKYACDALERRNRL